MSKALLDFLSAFANGTYSLANRIISIANQGLNDIVRSIDLPGEFVDDILAWIADFLPDISLLELITGSVTLVIAISVLKWFKGVFS